METTQVKEEEGKREGANSLRGYGGWGMNLPRGSLRTVWDPGGRKIQPSRSQRPREGQESLEA